MKKDKKYYKKLDKRSKEYRDWKKLQETLEDEVIEIEDKESEGLGDTLEKVFKKTGVKKVVEFLANGKDCGCDKRKAILNEMFRYKPECLVKSEYDYLNEYNKRHNPTRFSKDDVFKLTRMYQRIFKQRVSVCFNCNSAVKTMNDVVDNLNKVLKTYEDDL